ncbi:MAG: MBL fold metallo-hydrolase [Clostridia bacterium]
MKIYQMPLGMLQTNTYIVFDEISKETFVVDPATKADQIIEFLKSNELSLKAILITHAHFDHIGAVAELKEFCPIAKIYMHKNDLPKVDRTQMSRSLGMSIKTKQFCVDTFINDGDIINIAGCDIKVMFTPGHSSGSVCYIMDKTVFSGDTLFKDTYGRVNFDDGSIEDIAVSIKKLFSLDGDYQVLCGHGEGTTMSHERQFNPILRENRV